MDASSIATGNDRESPNRTASNVDSESLESELVDKEDDDDDPTAYSIPDFATAPGPVFHGMVACSVASEYFRFNQSPD